MSDRTRGWLLVLGQFVLIAVLVALPSGNHWSVPGWLRAVGAATEVAGTVAILAGVVQLGTRLRIHPAPTRRSILRTKGVYRYVRHPIYTGAIVLGVAVAAPAGNMLHVIVWTILVVVLAAKARLEERLLIERFPEYIAYMAATSRFVPWPRSRPLERACLRRQG